MINLELPEELKAQKAFFHDLAEKLFRPISRKYDEAEHTYPEELDVMRPALQPEVEEKTKAAPPLKPTPKKNRPNYTALSGAISTEEFAWGCNGLLATIPGSGLGNSAINAVGSVEQKKKFGKMWCAMALTEPEFGSDPASIRTSAKLDGDHYVLNGEKIFVTCADRCDAVVVWATLDHKLGRPAMKSFVVEKETPGFKLEHLEHKLGIRASDTGTFVLKDVRVPKENLLGSPEISKEKGMAGVGKTFDSVRPMIAAQSVGIARAALDFFREKLEEAGYVLDYKKNIHNVNSLVKEYYVMEATLDTIRLLSWKALWMLDNGLRNSAESSMSKGKGGCDGTWIVQKCCDLLGAMGFSRKYLVEKWMRDVKITDIYDGTGQIQRLIVSRQILGLSRDQLK